MAECSFLLYNRLIVLNFFQCILDSSGRNVVPEIPEVFQCMWEDCTTKFASAHDFYCHTLSHVRNTDKENSKKKAFICAWDGKTLSLL